LQVENVKHKVAGLKQLLIAAASARGSLKASIEKISTVDIRRACIQINDASRALYKLVFKRDVAMAVGEWHKQQDEPLPPTKHDKS